MSRIMLFTNSRRAAIAAAALAATAGCTIHDAQQQSVSGPSEFALTLRVTASPASITQDGASTSEVRVLAIDENGRPKANWPVRVDLTSDDLTVDPGTLSASSLMTGSDGTARVIYTAPPTPSNGIFGTCNDLPGRCVSVVAAPTMGNNFGSVQSEYVQIRLVPPGQIVPVLWTFSPATPTVNQDVTFNASGVAPTPGHIITSYRWDFSDGSTKTGVVVTHDFGVAGSYNVVLTTTDDSGQTRTFGKTVTVS